MFYILGLYALFDFEKGMIKISTVSLTVLSFCTAAVR